MKKILALMLVLASLFALCACGASSTGTPAPVKEEAADNTVEQAEESAPTPKTSKRMSSAYNGELKDYSFGDYVIKIPADWLVYEGNIYPEVREGKARAMIYANQSPGYSYATTKYLDQTGLLEGILDSLDSPEELSREFSTINGIEMFCYKVRFKNGYDHITSTFYYFIDGSGNLVNITVGESDLSSYDYTEDYEAVLNSIQQVEVTGSDEAETSEPVVGEDLSDKFIVFESSVRNDKTGKWRLAKTSEGIFIPNYAVSYYRNYFKSDSEVHFFIDFTEKTTARLTVGSGYIFITIFKYVEGEEHDATILPGGSQIGSYIVNIETGKIEKVD